jgi:glycosyltransferase involved in cell wall biosynthesis
VLHDLFQLYPPEAPLGSRFAIAKGKLFAWYYRYILNRLVLGETKFIVDSKNTYEEVRGRLKVESDRLKVVELGFDRAFSEFLDRIKESDSEIELARGWLAARGLAAGYVLLFFSENPRKNFLNSFYAWRSLEPAQKSNGLVVVVSNEDDSSKVAARLSSEERELVSFVTWVERRDLPFLYFGASVVLVPSLLEGFGLPAYEAANLGIPVVCGPLEFESMGDFAKRRLYNCNPVSLEDISSKLKAALVESGNRELTNKRQELISANASVRKMCDVLKETLEFCVGNENNTR